MLGRFALSQMDVPTRQAYVVAVVDPDERVAAAAYTNTARYVVRPIGPLVAGPILTVSLGVLFVIAGALKSVYDLGLYALFRHVKSAQQRLTRTAVCLSLARTVAHSPRIPLRRAREHCLDQAPARALREGEGMEGFRTSARANGLETDPD